MRARLPLAMAWVLVVAVAVSELVVYRGVLAKPASASVVRAPEPDPAASGRRGGRARRMPRPPPTEAPTKENAVPPTAVSGAPRPVAHAATLALPKVRTRVPCAASCGDAHEVCIDHACRQCPPGTVGEGDGTCVKACATGDDCPHGVACVDLGGVGGCGR